MVTVARSASAVLLAAALTVAGGVPALAQPTTDQITQYGITFHFDQAYAFGQFANGDYWVAGDPTTGQVGITGMTPDFTGTRNGWMVNPSHLNNQGLDSRASDPFDASLVAGLPYTASPGETILKALSLDYWTGGAAQRYSSRDHPKLETVSALTVVDAPLADGGAGYFRPPYFGDDKPLYSVDDLRLDLLPSLAPVASTPDLAGRERRFERLQLDHFNLTGTRGRTMRPLQHMPDYGAEIGRDTAVAALRLMLDDPIGDKQQLLVNYVQYGVDLYHMMDNGVQWQALGGQNLGRKLPMVFAAVMLDDEDMKQAIMNAPDNTFHEDGTIYYSGTAMTSLYGQPYADAERRYWLNQLTGGSARTIRDPYEYIDGGQTPGGSYQFCCNSQPFKGMALAMLLMPELREVWNHEPFIDYVDRWVNFGAWTQPDPYAADGEGEIDGVGRYPHLHGSNTDGGHYDHNFIHAMWEAYRGGVAVMMPHIATPGGFYDEPIDIVLLAPHEEGVEIRYTLDGSAPTADSLLYEGPFTLRGGNDVLLRVRGFKDGLLESAINNAHIVVVPEPGTVALLAMGLGVLVMRRRG
ncbi:MAG: chitobiase/beta-hexosaminidase C-terminal domain-containing protein [Phycisphaeraceae bacterium]